MAPPVPGVSIDELNEQLAEFSTSATRSGRTARSVGEPPEKRTAPRARPADPELAARTQATNSTRNKQPNRSQPPIRIHARKPVPKDERTGANARGRHHRPRKAHKIDRRGCITQDNIVGMRRAFNVGKHNAGRMAELLVDHGQAVITDLETGEISPTRRSTPPANTNTLAGGQCQRCPRQM